MMSDQNKHKDPVEQFFYQKSSEYDIPFKDESWKKIERELNVQDLLRKRKKIQYWFLAASIFIISLLSIVTLDHLQQIDQLNDLLGEQQHQQIIETPFDREFQEIPEAVTDVEESAAEPGPDTNRMHEFQDITSYTTDAGLSDFSFSAHPTDSTSSSDRIYMSTDFVTSYISLEDSPILSQTVNIGPAHYDRVDSGLNQSLSPERIDPFHDDMTSRYNQSNKLNVSIGLISGPDLSTVGSLTDFTDPGYQIGLTAEVGIFNEFSLITGIVQAKVRYQEYSHGANVNSSYGNDVMPVHTYAECSLLKIPLKAKYNLFDFKRSRLFATAELSSYIMIQEDYQFQFVNGSDPTQDSWSGRTGTSHWFSNAGLSIGYEVDLFPHWSIRAEPYLKIPVREVGWGNARLYSVGSYFSLNFQI